MTLNYLKSRIQMAGHVAISKAGFGITNYRHPHRTRALRNSLEARSLAYTATTPLECVELDHAVRAAEKVAGDMAEVGVYRGGTAVVMLKASPEKHLHLFDTFEGLPDSGDYLVAGEYMGSVETVERTLLEYRDRITLHQGLFPQETGDRVSDLRFSFVHLDMDLYDGTLAAMEFFWPRMNRGGIVLCHDYPQLEGVVRAMDDFFLSVEGTLLPLSGQQCLAVKTS